MILQLIECGLAGCQLFGIAPLETVALAVVTVFGMALIFADVFAEVVAAIAAIAVLIPVFAAAGRAAFVVAGALLLCVAVLKFGTDLVAGASSGVSLSVPLLSLIDTVLSRLGGGGKQGGKPPEQRQRQPGQSPNLFKDDDD
jgi:hypothetical protein